MDSNNTTHHTLSAYSIQTNETVGVGLWYRVILMHIITVSVPLNIMVFLRILLCRASTGKITPREILIASMAASDILQAFFGYILQYIAIQTDSMSSVYCQISGFSVTFLALVSMNHIVALSVDGYMHICKPWFTEKFNSLDHRLHVIYPVLSWLYAFIWTIVPLVGWGEYSMIERGNCAVDWNTSIPQRKNYVISMFILCFFIPVLTMFTCFTLTQMGLSKMHAFAVDRFGFHSVAARHNRRAEKNNIKTSFIIGTTFVAVWTPYAIFAILQVFGYDVTKKVPKTLFQSAALLAKSSVIFNPIFYTVRSEGFKKQVSKEHWIKLISFCPAKEKSENLPPSSKFKSTKT